MYYKQNISVIYIILIKISYQKSLVTKAWYFGLFIIDDVYIHRDIFAFVIFAIFLRDSFLKSLVY